MHMFNTHHIHAPANWVMVIASGIGLAPIRHQPITWINAWLLSIGLFEIYFSEIWMKMKQSSYNKMPLKMSSAKKATICFGF